MGLFDEVKQGGKAEGAAGGFQSGLVGDLGLDQGRRQL
jgi:hypothetical protein